MKIVISPSKGNSLIGFRGKLIKEWIKHGNEVICTSIESNKEMDDSITDLGAKYYQIKGSRTGPSIIEGFKMIHAYKKLYKKEKPDVAFLYMSKPIAFGGLAAIFSKVKHIYVFVTGLELAFYSKGIKNAIVRLVLKTLFKIVHSKADKVFFMNQDDYNTFLKMGLVKKEQSRFVHGSGIDLNHYTYKPLPDKDAVCMVGRLVWSKGVGEFVEAAKIVHQKYRDVEFYIVGRYDENPESLSKKEIKEIKEQGEVVLYGYQNDVRPYIEKCSIFVLPSYHEGNGRSIVQAEAMGRPIVTTLAPGCRETVEDSINGYLVPVKDGEKIADAIIRILDNPELKEQMSQESLRVSKKFDVNEVNKVFLNEMNIL